MDDILLRQNILDELEFEPSVDAADIGVAVDDGVVSLTGHVGSYTQKIAVEKAVQRVKGVRAIAGEIEVRYPSDKKLADDEIAKRALSIISWDTTVPRDKIKVKIEKGWITLTGEVAWQYQRAMTEKAVTKLSGVRGVTNLITIRPRLEAFNVKEHIESALKRNAEIEADAIRVAVSGSEVTLEGKASSWRERDMAQRAAWAVPGVTFVDNRIKIGLD